jgi:hypothetical protein
MGGAGWVTGNLEADESRRIMGTDAKTITRRAMLAAGAGLLAHQAAAALPVPPSNSLAFRLLRRGDDIGRHSVTFEHQGDVLTVRVEVNALVSLMSVPIVRYSHRAVETWQGGTLMGLVGDTDKNGSREWVRAQRTGEGLVVLGSRTARYVAPEPAIGTSYWNKRMLDGPMISLEDGVLLRPKVAQRREEAIRLASGGTIPAEHYNLSGPFAVDVWYDETNTWASLAFAVADGSDVHYERL